ncbi:MAG: 3-isopropylmalate dehydratase small subunit [Spirochaetota bacterium]
MKQFGGKVLFLDRSDINTDEIIPARYLTESTKEALKPFLLEDLSLNGFDNRTDIADKGVIVTRENFGCGSSREHAPWALEVNGINVVVAVNFARIFRQNMYNCGMCAIELSDGEIQSLFDTFAGKETSMSMDLSAGTVTFTSEATVQTIPFSMAPFDLELVKAGGWIEYADMKY